MHQKITSTLSQYDKIILVGGGTGGHIQPIASLVHSLHHEQHAYLWIGGSDSQERGAAKSENIEFISIPTLKLATTRSWRSLLYPFYLIIGFWRARQILCSVIAIRSPKEFSEGGRNVAIQDSKKQSTGSLPSSRGQKQIGVFSKGGPGSVAIGLAAWSLGIPLYIHESDTVPGRSNRILGKIAEKIFLGFESAIVYFDREKCEAVGQILDPVFTNQKTNPADYKSAIKWQTTKPHILVICGSQGSQAIFEEILSQYVGNNQYEWIIALGKLNSGLKSEFKKIPDCQAVDWIAQLDIAHLIEHADIAITRGSATTLAELTAFGKKPKLIIIPLPYSANNHQYHNAIEYEKIGHTILEQKNLDQMKLTIQQYV